MSCAARAFIGPRNDPSVSGSDEEVFVLFSLFTSSYSSDIHSDGQNVFVFDYVFITT